LPGKGKIDWVKVIEELDKAGYQGVWNYEVRDDEYDTFKDLKANFDNLFAQYNAKK
jgi:sugar phosphate isomerase/epimerase